MDRFKDTELTKVAEHFCEHPLMKSCRRAFKRYQAQMQPLLFAPEEVFCEAAIIIDHILELPQSNDVQTYIASLWDELRIKLSKWEKTASPQNLDMAISAILYTVAIAMNRHWATFYNFDVTQWLLQAITVNMKVDYQEMVRVFNDLLEEGDGIEDWINNDDTQSLSLTDEIKQTINPKNGTKTPKPESRKDDFKPVSATFTKSGTVLNANITLVFQFLVENKWIAQSSDPDAFMDLFLGKSSEKTIIWLKAKGVLRDLFKMFIDKSIITIPDGYTYLQIVSSHFTDRDGNYLTNLNSGYSGKKIQTNLSNILVLMKAKYEHEDE